MKVVIYCRYSSELQNPKSLVDQEREIRAGLSRLGVDASNAEVISDAAVSGTRTDRDGFDRIDKRIKNREPFLLVVDDQSRFTRLANALSLITDLVFAGGRFISICEQIDSDAEGWRLKVRVMELHHGACSDETANRVRRGQRGRVIDGKSAGDFGFGYESFAIDPEYAKRYSGRGPKPVMGVRTNRRQAKTVTWIFQQFSEGRSINSIARELTLQKVPRDRRARSHIWFAPIIRSMLSNSKYVGLWIWGKTKTVRDSDGNTKQVHVPENEHVVSQRPELRIVPQELWDKVQSRLANLRQLTGYKPGQRKRAPALHYTVSHPTDILMTLLRCGHCGAKTHHAGSGKHVYRECANGADGREACKEKARVPAAKAKVVLLEFVANLLKGMPDWVIAAVDEMRSAIHEFHERVPAELEELGSQLREAEQRRENLMRIAESGGVDDLEEFKQRLRLADDEAKKLRNDLDRSEAIPPAQVVMPDNNWVQVRLNEIANALQAEEASVARLLRDLIGTVQVFRVVPVGKKFGYQQLRFRICGWKTVCEALRDKLPPGLVNVIDKQQPVDGTLSPEFVLNVGGPHKLDILAPRIAEMRARGMKWKDIALEPKSLRISRFIAGDGIRGASECICRSPRMIVMMII